MTACAAREARRVGKFMTGAGIAIPLMRPQLPDADALMPYLKEIDSNRWYSNFGPLERRFEARLAAHFGLGERQVVCVANGTQALSIALRSEARYPVGYCLMPSFTFAATPHAAVSAGLEPYFVDVDRESWALEPDSLRELLPRLDGPIAAVVPVAPFGAPIDLQAWDSFATDTGIPVVIDAAAGFDTAGAGNCPVILSLHATKVLGIGEGGLVLCRNKESVERVRAGRNFGFVDERIAKVSGTNAKLSEYLSAVGLAALDSWVQVRQEFLSRARLYREVFEGFEGAEFSPGFATGSAGSTCNILLDAPRASDVIASLGEDGIEARRWWNRGCHKEPVFHGCRRTDLTITEFLGERVVGLPFYRDLNIEQINRIRFALERALSR